MQKAKQLRHYIANTNNLPMNKENYRKWSKDLFHRWLEQIRKDIQIGVDGASDPERYFSSSPRILFVLKEINGSPWIDDDLCEYFRNHKIQGKTWNNVVRWAQAIRQVWGGMTADAVVFEGDQSIDGVIRKAEIGQLAIINLKKVPGHSSSHMADIYAHAKQYSALLEEQISTLDPDVVVACGIHLTSVSAFKDLKYNDFDGALFRFNGRDRRVIWADHPQARKNAKKMFDGMVKAIASVM